MAAIGFNFLYFVLLILFLAIPGVLLTVPLLRKSKLNKTEKFLLSLFVGIFFLPLMLFIESFFGIRFSLFLVLFNLLLLFALGIFVWIKTFGFPKSDVFLKCSFPKLDLNLEKIDFEKTSEQLKPYINSVLLLLLFLLSFWTRIQTLSPIYSELDPYFYVYGASQIIKEGYRPMNDDTAWWPEVKVSHRGHGVKSYLEATWYSVYTKGEPYNNYLFYIIASFLPPIASSFMIFGAYLAVSSLFGRRYGLLVAALLLFNPISIMKMSAGVNELAPLGFMALFMTLGTYAFAIRHKELELSAISGFSFFVMTNTSNYAFLFSPVLLIYLIFSAVEFFASSKSLSEFLKLNLPIIFGAILGIILNKIDVTDSVLQGIFLSFSSSILLFLSIAAIIFFYILEKRIKQEHKSAILAFLILGFFVVYLFTPLNQIVKRIAFDFLGTVQFNYPLQKTIAEQNEAGKIFEGESGLIGFTPSLHKNDDLSLFANISEIFLSFFTNIFNFLISLLDSTFNLLFGTNIKIDQKENSLLFFFILTFIFGSIIIHIFEIKHLKENGAFPIILLFLLFAFPGFYIGIKKIKFTIFVGIMASFIAAIALGFIEKLLRKIANAKFDSLIKKVFSILIILLVLLQAKSNNDFALSLIGKSFITKYQDNPSAVMPHLASVCEEIRKKGLYDEEICKAGYDLNFSNTLLNQYNGKVCIVSQLSLEELIPSDQKNLPAILKARQAASYRCNRLPDYWIETMEWIKNNLNENDRVTSWWDYGHWINYFGEKKTVLRNDHSSLNMIGSIAYAFISATPEELAQIMNKYNSSYVFFDVEIIGGDVFGGKYGALNYLSCAFQNKTDVSYDPGTSICEYEHSPERLVVFPNDPTCTISESQRIEGVYAYRLTASFQPEKKPTYCIGEVTLKSGNRTSALYYLDKKDENGDLVLSKGFLRRISDTEKPIYLEVVYNEDQVWPGPNGTFVSGIEDATTKFYTSNLYRGFYLENLPGFDLVFKSKNGEVKIYKLRNYTGNPS
jgi:asparagine N-glycosylation enzyme membrane subunit Stt3